MNKRITSLVLVFVLVMSLLATAVPALAAQPKEITFTPDKTTVAPGETVTYTVTIGAIEHLQSMNFTLIIPEELGYVSGKEADGLKELLGAEKAEYTASTKAMIIYGGGDYTSTEDTEIMTFTCTIPETTAPGDYQLSLWGDEVVGNINWEEIDVTWNLESSKITVTAAPKPATDITLDKTELTLTAGDVETLTATVTPTDTTDTVVWESSKPAVATVNPATGEVTAVAPGEAVITAKAGSVSAACNVKVSCAHSLTTVAEKASNCTDQGWDEYQKCTLCGALFDMSGSSIAEIPYRPLNDDHDFNMSEWGYQGDDGHAHVCTRNPAHHDTVEAHNFGSDDICDICGYERMHVCANHLTKVEEKLADCTNPGNIEHYKCSCGKLYEDATAARELTEEDVNRGALGHDWIDATCTEAKTCDRCGETEGTALGHDWEGEWSSNADNHWHACTRCDAKDGEGAHNPGAPATETTPQTCIDCGYVIAPATGHVCADHLTKVEAKPATCTNPGNKEHYKCSNSSCGKLFWDLAATEEITDPTGVIIKATGHDYTKEITDAAHKRSTAADCREYDTYWYTIHIGTPVPMTTATAPLMILLLRINTTTATRALTFSVRSGLPAVKPDTRTSANITKASMILFNLMFQVHRQPRLHLRIARNVDLKSDLPSVMYILSISQKWRKEKLLVLRTATKSTISAAAANSSRILPLMR